jgi:hypothetical protein
MDTETRSDTQIEASKSEKPEGTNETTFGKPGEIVQKAVSGMEHATVSGEERERPRSRVLHNNDLEQPKPKKSHLVRESPTSTGQVHVSPAFGAEGPREHRD